jgi:two-component system NtrC family sensor kinase
LDDYLKNLFEMLAAYESAEAGITIPGVADRLAATRQQIDLAFLKQDIPVLMLEAKDGMQRVGQIVRDLKDFSRADSRQEWEWTDIRPGLVSTLNLIARDLQKVAEVVVQYGAVPNIQCLPFQLNQVFMNLLLNAAHAMGTQRGRICVRTATVQEEVWIEVSDTGCGIAADVLPRIFDPFFTTKPIGKGTGLGLSLSYGIVRSHQGRIEVDTAPGRGSTFRVVLPVSRQDSQLPLPA